jgi:hypothetical protein
VACWRADPTWADGRDSVACWRVDPTWVRRVVRPQVPSREHERASKAGAATLCARAAEASRLRPLAMTQGPPQAELGAWSEWEAAAALWSAAALAAVSSLWRCRRLQQDCYCARARVAERSGLHQDGVRLRSVSYSIRLRLPYEGNELNTAGRARGTRGTPRKPSRIRPVFRLARRPRRGHSCRMPGWSGPCYHPPPCHLPPLS